MRAGEWYDLGYDQDTKRSTQNFVTDFFESRCKKSLYIASKDCCSEMARLLGYIILKQYPKSEAFILKGKLSKNLDHDILAVKNQNNIILIDPTVWQIFKNKRNIFVGEYLSLDRGIKNLKSIYGGRWKISEELQKKDVVQMKHLKEIIEINIKGNCV